MTVRSYIAYVSTFATLINPQVLTSLLSPGLLSLCDHYIFSDAVVGLEKTFYSVSEDDGMLEVCAIVTSPDIGCPIQFPFQVSLSTTDGSAGTDFIIIDIIYHHIVVSSCL